MGRFSWLENDSTPPKRVWGVAPAIRRVAPTVNYFIIGQRKERRESAFPPYTGAGNEFPKKAKRQ